MEEKILRKIGLIIFILILFTGCSSLIENARKLEERNNEIRRKEIQNSIEGYKRLESYKNSTEYNFYKIEKIKGGHKIWEKYDTSNVYLNWDDNIKIGNIVTYSTCKDKEYIYEGKNKKWEILYRISGIKNTTDSLKEFSMDIVDVESGKRIEVKYGELNRFNKEEAYIPEIISFQYGGREYLINRKNHFADTKLKIGSLISGYKEEILSTSEYYGETGKYPDIVEELEIADGDKIIGILVLKEKDGGVYLIKEDISDDFKEYILKIALLEKIHKEIRKEVLRKFE